MIIYTLFTWRNSPQWARSSSVTRFLEYTRRNTVGRTSLDERSARRRDLYLTTHNIHNRQTSMYHDGIRTYNLSRRAAADPRLRPRGTGTCLSTVYIHPNYRGADKSLARPGRKQATVTEDFDFHISYS